MKSWWAVLCSNGDMCSYPGCLGSSWEDWRVQPYDTKEEADLLLASLDLPTWDEKTINLLKTNKAYYEKMKAAGLCERPTSAGCGPHKVVELAPK